MSNGHGNLVVGQKVVLDRDVLNEQKGSVGYVVETYQDYEDKTKSGAMIIFQNGSYDGFSYKDQLICLSIFEVDERYTDYEFKNVNSLVRDYRRESWEFSK